MISLKYKYIQKGFTLLEVIIALALASSLLLMTLSASKFVSVAWSESDNIAIKTETDFLGIYAIRKFIGDNLLAIAWVGVQEEGGVNSAMEFTGTGGREIGFFGNEEEIYFVAKTPVAASEVNGLFLYTIKKGKTEFTKKDALIIEYRPVIYDSLQETLDGEPRAEVLLENIKEFSIGYYGNPIIDNEEAIDAEDLGKENNDWYDSWLSQTRLPKAIRISVLRDKSNNEPNIDEILYPDNSWENVVIRINNRYLR